jgi:signal transduction histidine kinase
MSPRRPAERVPPASAHGGPAARSRPEVAGARARAALRRWRTRRPAPTGDRAAPAPLHGREPLAFRALAAGAAAAIAAVGMHAAVSGALLSGGVLLVWWAAFVAASNVSPAPSVRDVYLSLSTPVNVAVALLAPPGVAGALVAIASVSESEVRGEASLSRAVFNRAQLGLSTALASAVFGLGDRHAPGALVVAGGVAAYQAASWLLVSCAEWTSRNEEPHRVVRRLVPSGFAAMTYVLLGFAGVALALTFERVGGWAVALLMLPMLGARHAVTVSRRLEEAERTGRELADSLIHERERERARIASDIHDVVLQDLAALQLQADNLATAVAEGKSELVASIAGDIRDAAAQAISDLRGSIARLRRPSVDDDGLAATLARFARMFSRQSGVETSVHATRGVDALPMSVAVLLYECAQEALTNIARHAEASRAVVRLRADAGGAELKVIDDGIGAAAAEEPVGSGSGLALMREKLAMSGGGVWVTGAKGRGTELTVRVPVPTAGGLRP